jgi:hypothetical protein
MTSQSRAFKIETAADRRKLHHDGVKGVGEVSLFPRIGGDAGWPIVRGGHVRRCAGGVSRDGSAMNSLWNLCEMRVENSLSCLNERSLCSLMFPTIFQPRRRPSESLTLSYIFSLFFSAFS